MSVRQLKGWAEYIGRNPIGDIRADMRMARLCVMLASPWSKKKLKESEFMFGFGKPPKPPATEADLKRRASIVCAIFGGRFEGKPLEGDTGEVGDSTI